MDDVGHVLLDDVGDHDSVSDHGSVDDALAAMATEPAKKRRRLQATLTGDDENDEFGLGPFVSEGRSSCSGNSLRRPGPRTFEASCEWLQDNLQNIQPLHQKNGFL